MGEKKKFKSAKVNQMFDWAAWFWGISVSVFILLSHSVNPTTDKPSELSFALKEYNPLLACLPVAFAVFFAVKLTEFFLICLMSGKIIPKDKSILSWLVKHFHISYKAEQLVLKDETILLVWQFMFCVFGFFIELRWYLTGALGMVSYLCIYIVLSFRDIKNHFKKVIS